MEILFGIKGLEIRAQRCLELGLVLNRKAVTDVFEVSKMRLMKQ
jgi:hypothetical protein